MSRLAVKRYMSGEFPFRRQVDGRQRTPQADVGTRWIIGRPVTPAPFQRHDARLQPPWVAGPSARKMADRRYAGNAN
jgi:hypothetical protein